MGRSSTTAIPLIRNTPGRKQSANINDLQERVKEGDWVEAAQLQYVYELTNTPMKKDDDNLIKLLQLVLSQIVHFKARL